MRVAVVVLGDLGRSPRMLYHAKALAAQHVDVDLVGYIDSDLPSFVRGDSQIEVHAVRGPAATSPGVASRARYLATAIFRGVVVSVGLTRLLIWSLARPDVILVQNPPGVPALAIAWLACRVRSARLVVDWHNLTYAMLSLRLGSAHRLVRAVRWYEGVFGRKADVNLFVSSAMQKEIGDMFQLGGVAFRDRPAEVFEPITSTERDRIRHEIRYRLNLPTPPSSRFAMAVSPSSWTADEDFDLLIDAIAECETLVAAQKHDGDSFPLLLVLLTGRGPLRQHYERQITSLKFERIHVRTLWLESGEYTKVLAAADLGLSLHRSASGIDLPMKILDMFGAGIPVCALNYGPCLSELVHHGENGLLFSTASELAHQLHELFALFPADDRLLALLRGGVAGAQSERWQVAWNREVWPAVRGSEL